MLKSVYFEKKENSRKKVKKIKNIYLCQQRLKSVYIEYTILTKEVCRQN
jgi:hypothetical protein